MSDKSELDIDAERATFEAAGTRLHGWGEHDYRREQKGWQELGDYIWLEQRRAFALWLTARRATIQPTAAPVGEVILFGGTLKEVAWAKGKMPEHGTKLYAAPADAAIQPTAAPSDEAVANAARAFVNAGKRGCDMFGAISAALAEAALCAPVAPADAVRDAAQWISVEQRLPIDNELVLVYAPNGPHDWPGEIRITFDCIDPNDDEASSWLNHNEHYEHFCCVAKPEGSIGPSAKAPYTHWMPLPAAPTSTPKEPAK